MDFIIYSTAWPGRADQHGLARPCCKSLYRVFFKEFWR